VQLQSMFSVFSDLFNANSDVPKLLLNIHATTYTKSPPHVGDLLSLYLVGFAVPATVASHPLLPPLQPQTGMRAAAGHPLP
jgi:hypothetical protein